MIPARWWTRPRHRVVAVCLLAGLALVPPAFAQIGGRPTQGLLDRPLPGTRLPGQPEPQVPLRAPITLTPSLGVAEEYNDNIFMNNDRREWDLITVITPGLSFTAERPTWRFNAAYDFDARLYAREPNRNNGFDRQNLDLDSFYRLDPTLTVSLDDTLSYNTGINAFSPEGVVTGRDKSLSNTIRPGVTWQIDRLTSARAFGAWTAQRFERDDLRDSDTYRADVGLDHQFTPRLRGSTSYQYAFFDIEDVQDVQTHTPRLGLSYEFTPTISGSISAGPTFELRGGQSRVTPAVTAALRKRYEWGGTALTYSRDVGLAGGLGGTADNQTIGASVVVGTLLRGLTVEATPQYRTSESEDNTIDVRTFSLPIRATYQLTAYFAVTAGYAFLHQRSDSTVVSPTTGEVLGRDVDQNRVFVGIIVGYPIKWD